MDLLNNIIRFNIFLLVFLLSAPKCFLVCVPTFFYPSLHLFCLKQGNVQTNITLKSLTIKLQRIDNINPESNKNLIEKAIYNTVVKKKQSVLKGNVCYSQDDGIVSAWEFAKEHCVSSKKSLSTPITSG